MHHTGVCADTLLKAEPGEFLTSLESDTVRWVPVGAEITNMEYLKPSLVLLLALSALLLLASGQTPSRLMISGNELTFSR